MSSVPVPPQRFEVIPEDLSAYRRGNIGIDYVHRFDSGKAGPHVLINALTHGNEVCGARAATHLLDQQVRPRIGTLTVCFANVAAHDTFDREQPFASRLLVHNLNRIWTRDLLESAEQSPELQRARELRPVLEAADHVLDLHSTQNDVQPFWIYSQFERNCAAALAIASPSLHLMLPQGMGLGAGTPLIQWGHHGSPQGRGVALIAECGQHFLQATTDRAIRITRAFLAGFGLIEPDAGTSPPPPQRRLVLERSHIVKTPEYRLVGPLLGFEVFQEGELIATDGDEEIRAPFDDCTVVMPIRHGVVGREGLYLARTV